MRFEEEPKQKLHSNFAVTFNIEFITCTKPLHVPHPYQSWETAGKAGIKVMTARKSFTIDSGVRLYTKKFKFFTTPSLHK